MKDEEKLYSIGEICERTGLTLRTLRYYHSIELLEPSEIINGRRYYNLECLKILQQISTLKYIGLSLEEIKDILNKQEEKNITDFKYSLMAQRSMLKDKIKHMVHVERALTNAIDAIDENDFKENQLMEVIEAINEEKDWNEQYKNANSLNLRIKFHDVCSTAKEEWFKWYFRCVKETVGQGPLKILEVAAGQGAFWNKNKNIIPGGWDITLSDISQGMLEECKNNLCNVDRNFKYKIIDCENIAEEDESYDLLIGNHFLYHIQDIDRGLKEIKRVLKRGGYFFVSTIGENHLIEMDDIAKEFNKEVDMTVNHDKKFGLQNGESMLEKYFTVLEKKIHDDSLIVKESKPLVDHMLSFPYKGKELLEQDIDKFTAFIDEKIKNKPIDICKETGFFICKK